MKNKYLHIGHKSVCKKLTIKQRAYLAGLIDGDGSLKKYKQTGKGYYWRLMIMQSDIRSLDFIKEWIGYGSIKPHSIKERSGKFHFYGLYHSNTLLDLLQQIVPYLVWKQEAAKQAIIDLKQKTKL